MKPSHGSKPRGSGPRGKKPYRGGSGQGGPGGRFRKKFKKRGCMISAERKGAIDYKDADFLAKFVSDKGKIFPRSHTGSNAKKQRELARAIKKARAAGLLKIAR